MAFETIRVRGFVPEPGLNAVKCISCGAVVAMHRMRDHFAVCDPDEAWADWQEARQEAFREIVRLLDGTHVVDKVAVDAVWARAWAPPPWIHVVMPGEPEEATKEAP